jgi:hypothetical protein
LTCRHGLSWSTAAGEKVLAWFFAGSLQVVVTGLAGLVRQFELDRSPGFLLPYGCAIGRITIGCNILDLQGHDIAAPQLAVDGQIEQGEVAGPPSISSRVRIDQTCFGRSGGLAPISLPLFQSSRRGLEEGQFSRLDMIVLLVTEEGEHCAKHYGRSGIMSALQGFGHHEAIGAAWSVVTTADIPPMR